MTSTEFTITVYDSTLNSDVVQEVVALYSEIYADPPYLEGAEDFVNFADDLPRRATQESFRLVVARKGAAPLGFALGHKLSTPARWWDGLLTPAPADVTMEHSGRTFAVIELAVLSDHRQRGVGRRLHAHLTTDLNTERTTLLVRPEAEPAQASYLSWGYKKVAQIRPTPTGPTYDAMIRINSPSIDSAATIA